MLISWRRHISFLILKYKFLRMEPKAPITTGTNSVSMSHIPGIFSSQCVVVRGFTDVVVSQYQTIICGLWHSMTRSVWMLKSNDSFTSLCSTTFSDLWCYHLLSLATPTSCWNTSGDESVPYLNATLILFFWHLAGTHDVGYIFWPLATQTEFVFKSWSWKATSRLFWASVRKVTNW